MKKKFWNGISAKIVFVFILFLVPVYIILFVSVNSHMNSLQTIAVNSADTILEINLNGLDAEVSNIDQFIFNIQESDTDYIRLCDWKGSSRDYISFFSLNNHLINQLATYQYLDVFYVYIEETDTLLVVGPGYDRADKLNLEEMILENHLADHNIKWQILDIQEKNYYVHTIGYYGVYLGVLIDMDDFMDQLMSQIGYVNTVETVSNIKKIQTPENYITVSREIASTGSYIHIFLDKMEISQAMPEIAKITYRLAFLAFLLIPGLLLAFWRMIVKPIRRIDIGLKRLGEGDQDYRIKDFHSSNEFERLSDSFNSMAGEIQTLKIESYEKKLEKEQMAHQNLLLQIQPHFVLNTFNQIFSMAQLKDFDGIQKMSVYLSKYFRYLFRSDRTATIRSELDVVQNYLDMMQRRFLDCFVLECDLDECLMDYQIPPLLIHNFVENIFKYAVSEGCETLIQISLKKEGDYVVLTVADDGPGMEEEILEKIRAMKPVDKHDGTHIGIWNSTYWLKTLCGEEAQLIVESVLSAGTTVKIMLPVVSG